MGESLRGGFHRGNLQSIFICDTNEGYLSYGIYIKDLSLRLQVMTYMLQGSFLNSSFYTVRAHPEHLLYQADRAAARPVLVMNTNERVTETEHSCSLCSSERWREVTVSASKWPKYPFKSPEGHEGRTAGVWHTTTPLPVRNVTPEATRSKLRRNPSDFFLWEIILSCSIPSASC